LLVMVQALVQRLVLLLLLPVALALALDASASGTGRKRKKRRTKEAKDTRTPAAVFASDWAVADKYDGRVAAPLFLPGAGGYLVAVPITSARAPPHVGKQTIHAPGQPEQCALLAPNQKDAVCAFFRADVAGHTPSHSGKLPELRAGVLVAARLTDGNYVLAAVQRWVKGRNDPCVDST
jgi:hypothetical protein